MNGKERHDVVKAIARKLQEEMTTTEINVYVGSYGIKHKTTYRVNFDGDKLIADCVDAVQKMPPITKTRARYRKAELEIGKGVGPKVLENFCILQFG